MPPQRAGWSLREDMAENVRTVLGGEAGAALSVWVKGDNTAIVTRHPFLNEKDVRWHISISRPDRMPDWNTLVSAAHALRPGVPFCMGVPPETWWMNVHPYVLHLWETKDDGLIAEWRRNARGDRPT